MPSTYVPVAAYRTDMPAFTPAPVPPGGNYAPGGVLPYPEQPSGKPPRRSPLLVAIGATAVTAGLVGAIIGAVAGVTITARDEPAAPNVKSPAAAEIYAANVDLCTRFAAAYAAMPAPQNSGMDILPVATAIDQALNENPNADYTIREAIRESGRLLHEHAATLIHEPDKGFVISPKGWSAEKANAADKRAWDVCQAAK